MPSPKPREGVTTLIPRRRYSSAIIINKRFIVLGIFDEKYKADKVFRMAVAMQDRYECDTQLREITGANRLCMYRLTSSMAYTLTKDGWNVRVPLAGVFHDMGTWGTRTEAGLAYDVARYSKEELEKKSIQEYKVFVRDKTEELMVRAGYRVYTIPSAE